MPFVFDLFLHEFHNELYAGHGADRDQEVLEFFVPDHIPFQQPEKIQMFEFGQEVFAVELIVV
jgi:hypothetical protein